MLKTSLRKKPYGLTNNTAIKQAHNRKNYEDNVVGISSQPLSRCLLRESALEKIKLSGSKGLELRKLPAKIFPTIFAAMNDGIDKVLSFVVSFSVMRSRERLSTLITRKSFA